MLTYCFESSHVPRTLTRCKRNDLAVIDTEWHEKAVREAFSRGVWVYGYLNASHISICTGLKTGKNEVFYDISYSGITQAICDAYMAENIPIEAWTVNDESVLLGLNKYVSGVTSDSLIAGRVLYDNVMNT